MGTEVTPELETVGWVDFGGRLTTAMTAHPKVCPRTGELHFFGYAYLPPFLTYHRADAGGRLVQSEVIEVPGAKAVEWLQRALMSTTSWRYGSRERPRPTVLAPTRASSR